MENITKYKAPNGKYEFLITFNEAVDYLVLQTYSASPIDVSFGTAITQTGYVFFNSSKTDIIKAGNLINKLDVQGVSCVKLSSATSITVYNKLNLINNLHILDFVISSDHESFTQNINYLNVAGAKSLVTTIEELIDSCGVDIVDFKLKVGFKGKKKVADVIPIVLNVIFPVLTGVNRICVQVDANTYLVIDPILKLIKDVQESDKDEDTDFNLTYSLIESIIPVALVVIYLLTELDIYVDIPDYIGTPKSEFTGEYGSLLPGCDRIFTFEDIVTLGSFILNECVDIKSLSDSQAEMAVLILGFVIGVLYIASHSKQLYTKTKHGINKLPSNAEGMFIKAKDGNFYSLDSGVEFLQGIELLGCLSMFVDKFVFAHNGYVVGAAPLDIIRSFLINDVIIDYNSVPAVDAKTANTSIRPDVMTAALTAKNPILKEILGNKVLLTPKQLKDIIGDIAKELVPDALYILFAMMIGDEGAGIMLQPWELFDNKLTLRRILRDLPDSNSETGGILGSLIYSLSGYPIRMTLILYVFMLVGSIRTSAFSKNKENWTGLTSLISAIIQNILPISALVSVFTGEGNYTPDDVLAVLDLLNLDVPYLREALEEILNRDSDEDSDEDADTSVSELLAGYFSRILSAIIDKAATDLKNQVMVPTGVDVLSIIDNITSLIGLKLFLPLDVPFAPAGIVKWEIIKLPSKMEVPEGYSDLGLPSGTLWKSYKLVGEELLSSLMIDSHNKYGEVCPNLMTLLGTNIPMDYVLNTFDINSLAEFEDAVAEDPDSFRLQQMAYLELCSTLISPIGDGWSSCPTKQQWEELFSTIIFADPLLSRDGYPCCLIGLFKGPNGKEYLLLFGHYIPETYHNNESHPNNEELRECTVIVPFVDNNTIYYQKVILLVDSALAKFVKVRFDYETLPLLPDYPVFTYIPAVISKK